MCLHSYCVIGVVMNVLSTPSQSGIFTYSQILSSFIFFGDEQVTIPKAIDNKDKEDDCTYRWPSKQLSSHGKNRKTIKVCQTKICWSVISTQNPTTHGEFNLHHDRLFACLYICGRWLGLGCSFKAEAGSNSNISLSEATLQYGFTRIEGDNKKFSHG